MSNAENKIVLTKFTDGRHSVTIYTDNTFRTADMDHYARFKIEGGELFFNHDDRWDWSTNDSSESKRFLKEYNEAMSRLDSLLLGDPE